MRILVLLFFTVFCLYAQSPWHKSNLYNDKTLSYFIPLELWLGTNWDGSRAKNLHEVDKMLETSQKLTGPFKWYHPYLKKTLNVYKRTSKNNVELFTFYPSGMIKVYDKKHKAYLNNAVTFPLGYGWKVGKLYRFSQEVWIKERHFMRELGINIQKIDFNKEELQSITYDYFIENKHVATYQYKVDNGLTIITEMNK